MEIVYTLEQLRPTAEAFWRMAGDANVIAFHGKMGAGKTTFIHALCDVRNVKDVVGSPTFAIINEYFFLENNLTKRIFHIDLYRVNSEREAILAGVEDCFYGDHICMVEWAEKIPSLLPDDTLHVFIEPVDTETRRLRIADN